MSATARAGIAERFIDVDGVRTRYRETGTGLPIVLVHGAEFGGGAGSDAWPDEVYLGLAARGHRVIGIDRLGQAMTGDPLADDQFRISASAAHAARLLDLIGVGGAVLAGQSRGAFIALLLARTRPDLVAGTVLVNSASVTPGKAAEPQPGTLPYLMYEETMNGDVRHDAAAMSVSTGHITDAWVARKEAIVHGPARARTAARFAGARAAYYAEFERVKAETLAWVTASYDKPTLVVWGVGDPTTTAEDGLEIFSMLRGNVDVLRAHFVNRCGHWPFREYPEEFVDQVDAFVGAAGLAS